MQKNTDDGADGGGLVPAYTSRGAEMVSPDQAELEMVSPRQMFSDLSNMIPGAFNMKGSRLLISGKYFNQALPTEEPEAPLVDAYDPETGEGFSSVMGGKLGLRRSRVSGRVVNIGKDFVRIRDKEGKLHTEELFDHFPNARKTFVHETPLVKVGDEVGEGQPIARNNFATDSGEIALGRNLRVAFAAAPGGSSFEDSISVSESAAKKLTSTHMAKFELDTSREEAAGKSKFVSRFPNRYTKEQLDKLDDNGVAKPGQVLAPGDPVVLSLKPRTVSSKDASLGNLAKMFKGTFDDASQVWDHPQEGFVTDAAKGRKGFRVNVKYSAPLQVGDKLSARQGAKGVVGKIVRQDEMPVGEDGEPIGIFINPAALIGRVNPAMVFEAQMGKLARLRGTKEVLQDGADGDMLAYVRRRLQEEGVSPSETITDPVTGRSIPDVMTGVQYFMKLEHTADGKLSARDEGATDINEQPAKGGPDGAKRLGGLMNTALLGHGATEVLRDAHVYRGVDDPEVWSAVTSGRPLPQPKVPFIYQKYLNTLRAAGIRVDEDGGTVSIAAMTDKDVDALSPREVNSSATIDDRTGGPVPGGLFDYSLFGGPEQRGWGFVKLDEPVPNPVMEDSVRAVLGLTQKKLRAVVSGDERIGGGTGPQAVRKALSEIDAPSAAKEALQEVRSTRGSARDRALKRLKALRGLEAAGLKPEDMMLTKVPVLPPAFRPAVKMGDMTIVADANYLYKDLLNARDAYRANREILPDGELKDERLAVYDAVRAVQGVGDPIHAETREKGVKGFLKSLTGDGSGPKRGLFLSKVLGHPVNAVGRSVIVPDARLDMDKVGIPEEMAWTSFEPFTMGRMVRAGMKPKEAARQIEARTPIAKKFLLEEMKARPVMYSRDPALHKFSIMGGEPVLVPGDAIRISPLVVKGFNADFDGNCIVGSSKIFLAMEPGLFESFGMNDKSRVLARAGKTVAVVEIKNFPHLETFRVDKNGAKVYDVPEGVETLTVGEDGQGARWSAVTHFTVEDGCRLKKVVTRGKREVVCSDNESIAAYKPGGGIERIAPDGSVGRFLPVALSIPPTGAERGSGDLPAFAGRCKPSEFGWFVGALASDGWTSQWGSGRSLFYSKASSRKRERVRKVISLVSPDIEVRDVDPGGKGFGEDRMKLGAYLGTASEEGTPGGDLWRYVENELYHPDGPPEGARRCICKKLPDDVLSWSREARIGVLSGLIDGDGTLCVSNSKRKPQAMCGFSTSSPHLRDSVRMLCSSLGIRTSYSFTDPKRGRSQKHRNYVVAISTVDLSAIVGEMDMVAEGSEEALALLGAGSMKDDRDVVPIEFAMLDRITGRDGKVDTGAGLSKGALATIKSKASANGGCCLVARSTAERILEAYTGEKDGVFETLSKVAGDRTVTWDPVASVEDAPTETVYDLCVPETKVFALESGLVVYDSMNVHIPVSDGAIKEIRKKMMPSRNLLSISKRKPLHVPSQEFVLGIFNATRPNPAKGEPVRFATAKEAADAYREDRIEIDTPIVVG